MVLPCPLFILGFYLRPYSTGILGKNLVCIIQKTIGSNEKCTFFLSLNFQDDDKKDDENKDEDKKKDDEKDDENKDNNDKKDDDKNEDDKKDDDEVRMKYWYSGFNGLRGEEKRSTTKTLSVVIP